MGVPFPEAQPGERRPVVGVEDLVRGLRGEALPFHHYAIVDCGAYFVDLFEGGAVTLDSDKHVWIRGYRV